MSHQSWESRNEDHLREMAGDESLSDADYLDALDDLVDRAESAAAAKREEMDQDADEEN